MRDRDKGIVQRMWGSYVDVPGSVADAAIAERAARTFLAAHLDQLAPSARAADFVILANQLDGDIRSVAFAQTWRGLRVHGGAVGIAFSHDRLFAIASSAWPHVSATITAGAREINARV